jgi:hypothetical protein
VERGSETASPLAYLYALETRDPYYSVLYVRLMQEAPTVDVPVQKRGGKPIGNMHTIRGVKMFRP